MESGHFLDSKARCRGNYESRIGVFGSFRIVLPASYAFGGVLLLGRKTNVLEQLA